ncbi:MAG: DegT/DnrJ/EryC1/StrS family aminotransferase [Deltaproteobacteria bacterium]|nr:DegT/DnrJ/EryC1/StrS family aminotransferase [Deltaproteobacteria bacterium]MBW2070233.1 DegT/DnrJ/EryC1/StrS family aminotransferase [Deltaproteobacteria bacterium]
MKSFQVPFIDFKAQYRQIKRELEQAFQEVMDSQLFILGPQVARLERALAKYCGCQYAVGVSSGTDALLISLMTAGIGLGHGVITTPYTFVATAGAIARVGARPLFVDIDPVSYTIDSGAVQRFFDQECRWHSAEGRLQHKRTATWVRGIIPVHLYGQCADMEPLLILAGEYNLVVIEDAAQAIGAGYPFEEKSGWARCGSLGEFGCFSFFPTKNLGGAGDSGLVTTSNRKTAETLGILRVHGAQGKNYHVKLGGNFRLDTLQAAILLAKLGHLDEWTVKRRAHAKYYETLFLQAGLQDKERLTLPRAVWEEGLQNMAETGKEEPGPPYYGHVYNQYVIRAHQRDELRRYLAEQGVGTAVYYPLPLHLQPCFSELGYDEGDFPESEKAARETLALPVYPELEKAQLDYVADRIAAFYE